LCLSKAFGIEETFDLVGELGDLTMLAEATLTDRPTRSPGLRVERCRQTPEPLVNLSNL
jgi:hypothetical protein